MPDYTDPIVIKAQQVIYQACSDNGIAASADPLDNYNRIFSRDAVMTGVAGILLDDPIIIQALKVSLLALKSAQAETGQVPSNLSFDDENNIKDISYGRLSAKIDANTWFVIGSALYVRSTKDYNFAATIFQGVQKALAWLKVLELNGRGFTYVPEGGNWADEYIISGYTLYDQVLRYWALKKASEVWSNPDWKSEASLLLERIQINFWPSVKHSKSALVYHQHAYNNALNDSHKYNYWLASLMPSSYDTRFDLAGNTLALLLGIGTEEQNVAVFDFVEQVAAKLRYPFPPVFWPIIHEGDESWNKLKSFYLFHFKNEPHHYHNGGIWPIWIGWWALALQVNGKTKEKSAFADQMLTFINKQSGFQMDEYFSSDSFQPFGTKSLCFTATGLLFLFGKIPTDLKKLF